VFKNGNMGITEVFPPLWQEETEWCCHKQERKKGMRDQRQRAGENTEMPKVTTKRMMCVTEIRKTVKSSIGTNFIRQDRYEHELRFNRS